ncbi:MAG TPA: hypothetical protein VII64_06255 [Thermodesulfobacteriota bacterium]
MKGRQFQRGEVLTHKQSILAQCFVCNGLDEGGVDCLGKSCPLYQFMPHWVGRVKKQISEARRIAGTDALRRYRESRKGA